MKKILLLIFIVGFAWLGGFAAGPEGWCLALKKVAGFHHIYTDLEQYRLSRHYDFMLIGYDSRNSILIVYKRID